MLLILFLSSSFISVLSETLGAGSWRFTVDSAHSDNVMLLPHPARANFKADDEEGQHEGSHSQHYSFYLPPQGGSLAARQRAPAPASPSLLSGRKAQAMRSSQHVHRLVFC